MSKISDKLAKFVLHYSNFTGPVLSRHSVVVYANDNILFSYFHRLYASQVSQLQVNDNNKSEIMPEGSDVKTCFCAVFFFVILTHYFLFFCVFFWWPLLSSFVLAV